MTSLPPMADDIISSETKNAMKILVLAFVSSCSADDASLSSPFLSFVSILLSYSQRLLSLTDFSFSSCRPHFLDSFCLSSLLPARLRYAVSFVFYRLISLVCFSLSLSADLPVCLSLSFASLINRFRSSLANTSSASANTSNNQNNSSGNNHNSHHYYSAFNNRYYYQHNNCNFSVALHGFHCKCLLDFLSADLCVTTIAMVIIVIVVKKY